MILTCKEAARIIMGEVEEAGTETLALVKNEAGTENFIAGISQRLEMNIMKYGSQYNAIRNGLYDLVEYKGTLSSISEVNKLNKNIDTLLENVFLAEMGEEVIPTLDGLTGNLAVFTTELYVLFRGIEAYGVELVDRIDNIIADFIGNKEVRDSFIQLDQDLSLAKTFNIDVKSLVDRNFSNVGHETIALKSLVGNNAQYKESVSNLVKINSIFSNKELSKIEKKVSDIEARFEILLDVLKDGKELKSKSSVELLVTTLDTMGKFLTNLSAVYYFNVRTLDIVLNIKLLIK